jgi:catechol 2,3-dioxygenase-like lactoylglutathione lyase family enzyme
LAEGVPSLVPELYCRDVEATRAFYVGALGFEVRNERADEGFLHLELGKSEMMFEQVSADHRQWLLAPLEYPFGRGISFEITVEDVMVLHERALSSGRALFLPLEEKWYRIASGHVGVRQFIVPDPDGYLLRFAQEIGHR